MNTDIFEESNITSDAEVVGCDTFPASCVIPRGVPDCQKSFVVRTHSIRVHPAVHWGVTPPLILDMFHYLSTVAISPGKRGRRISYSAACYGDCRSSDESLYSRRRTDDRHLCNVQHNTTASSVHQTVDRIYYTAFPHVAVLRLICPTIPYHPDRRSVVWSTAVQFKSFRHLRTGLELNCFNLAIRKCF